jgi:hypothetical protein
MYTKRKRKLIISDFESDLTAKNYKNREKLQNSNREKLQNSTKNTSQNLITFIGWNLHSLNEPNGTKKIALYKMVQRL